jgi:uncharacterized protein YndB with AHSA1/START domain
MPTKKDGTGKRWVEMELLLPGAPEQVWAAFATGAGYSAWFTPTTIEERFGGKLEFEFGPGMASTGEITAWEPPQHFGYVEREWSEGAPPCATEITITARSGDKCVVRMVHSLFTSSDAWDDQMEGFENGWAGFFDVLRVYLAHFAGQRASSVRAMAGFEGTTAQGWERATTRLGLAGANLGDARRIAAGARELSGIVECVHQTALHRYLLLRLDAPTPGIAVLGAYSMGGRTMMGLSLYFYGEGSESTAESAKAWQDALAAILV